MTQFQDMMDGVKATETPNIYSAFVLPTWLQGRTAFGGLSSALVVQAMLQQVSNDRRLRSIAVNFVGPVPDGNHEVHLRLLREGGSVTHMQGDLLCNGEVALTLLATFGKDRPSKVVAPSPTMPKPAAMPDALQPWTSVEAGAPIFTTNFDMLLASGSMPFSGADNADMQLWMRFRDNQLVTMPTLIALADAPPMPGLNMISPPGIGSSLTWYLEFPAPLKDYKADSYWLMEYKCQSGGGGYYHNYGTVWNEDGTAAMFSRQVATVFER